MSTVLDDICETKRIHVQAMRDVRSVTSLREAVKTAPATRGFISALRQKEKQNRPGLIAEIKKASPSSGLIRADFNPVLLAAAYEDGGAACLSVLTDEPYFQGRDEYLQQARAACDLPVLRKDFIVDPWQVYETRVLGADCLLLIMAALDDSLARDMYSLATDLGLDVLVEVHDESELERALSFSPAMIGVNSRNLKTLEVNLDTALRLAALIPADALKVGESGIHDPKDIARLREAGYSAFLVGESLMRQKDVSAATRTLLGI